MKTTFIGVLIGNDQEGYTSFFKGIPLACAEGRTKAEAQTNLIEMLGFMSEYLKENFSDLQTSEGEGNKNGIQHEYFSADLVLR